MIMQQKLSRTLILALALAGAGTGVALAADVVPNEIKMPGTQPQEVTPLDAVSQCANCHGSYDATVEPLHNWRGSMMAHAGRDPLFWATLAVAEQHFDGAGDLCTRCHNIGGWLEGRSTPTDGSGLSEFNDRDGIECDLCHRLSNPDLSEHLGVQIDPFLAYTIDPLDGSIEGNYGSGQYVVMLGNGTKYGPYAGVNTNHGTAQSRFHRSSDLCGTCHDVSNPVTGDLAHNNGAQVPLGVVGTLDDPATDPVDANIAFNYHPYQFGIVERTYSEHQASKLTATRVADYPSLPAELQAGAIKRAYDAAVASGNGGNYADGTTRYFTCQTCHLHPITGRGASRPNRINIPVRTDLPLHDMTGGNYWVPEATKWLDKQGRLVLGSGLTDAEIAAMDAGALRARANLEAATSLSVSGNVVRVVNLTGHKAISGYPEGRRMWLNIRWYDSAGNLLREDGAYDALTVTLDGQSTIVRTLLDLHDPNTHIYEVHGSITQEWASQLLALGYDPNLVLRYDRMSGQPQVTLQDVASQAAGTFQETLHFVLNNHISSDTRIPPYGFSYDEAKRRNTLPVPADQYGNPGAGGVYNHWDELTLNPPTGATTASIRLLYQPTSWEYVQFLYLANNQQDAFLASTGRDYLDAWLNNGMAEPHVMASATWGAPPPAVDLAATVESVSTGVVDQFGTLTATTTFNPGDTVGVLAKILDQDGVGLPGASVGMEIRNSAGTLVASMQATSDNMGAALGTWQTTASVGFGRRATAGTPTGTYTAKVVSVVLDGYTWDTEASVTTTSFVIQ
jgi:hypothetical protein